MWEENGRVSCRVINQTLMKTCPQNRRDLNRLPAQMSQLMEDHENHCRNAVADCYTNGTFSKVLEFRDFLRRGQASVSLVDAHIESVLAAVRSIGIPGGLVVKGASSASDLLGALWAALEPAQRVQPFRCLTINSDLSQLPHWLPPPAGPWYVSHCFRVGTQDGLAGRVNLFNFFPATQTETSQWFWDSVTSCAEGRHRCHPSAHTLSRTLTRCSRLYAAWASQTGLRSKALPAPLLC
jgi:hypothetical protein